MTIMEDPAATFDKDLYINCSGTQSTSTWAITPDYNVGKNVIIATNDFKLVGLAHPNPSSKLTVSAFPGDKSITVKSTLGWTVGNTIVITTSSEGASWHDEVVI